MYDRTPKCAREVLRYAAHRAAMGEKPTYIVCGKPGPTGKTWLWNELRKAGHDAIELSEGLGRFVDYRDNENHMCDCGLSAVNSFGLVIIVLNKPLDDAWGPLLRR